MEAIKSNLTNQSLHEIMLCTKCKAEYSAHDDDYWWASDGHKFMCCDKVMIIGYWRHKFIES